MVRGHHNVRKCIYQRVTYSIRKVENHCSRVSENLPTQVLQARETEQIQGVMGLPSLHCTCLAQFQHKENAVKPS